MKNMNKTIITTVGASIITNFLKDNNDFNEEYEEIRDKNISDKNNVSYDEIKNSINSWLKEKRGEELLEICAEIKSLKKIKEKYDCNLDVKFIATDTILSVMSAEIICEYLKQNEGKRDKYEFKDEYIIRKTDVHNNIYFNEGIKNLVYILEKISYRGCIINFSGGYKSLIPYLTIYASMRGLILCYIYENSEELIELRPLRLNIDMEIIQKLEKYLDQIEKENEIRFPRKILSYEQKIKDLFNICIIRNEDGKCRMSTLGYMIWQIYKDNKEIELVKDNTPSNEKKIKLSSTHHGNEILMKFCKKLVNSDYIKEIIDSLSYKPKERNFISEIRENGILEIRLPKDDRGIGVLVQTTGRNIRETEKIAKILEEKFYN